MIWAWILLVVSLMALGFTIQWSARPWMNDIYFGSDRVRSALVLGTIIVLLLLSMTTVLVAADVLVASVLLTLLS